MVEAWDFKFGTEQTPEMHPEPVSDSQEPDSGWMASCYICGRDLTRLPEPAIDRKYRVIATDGKPLRSYILSFCGSCSHTWLKST
jgi:hypothetical protein